MTTAPDTVQVPREQWEAAQRLVKSSAEVHAHVVNCDCDGDCAQAVRLWQRWTVLLNLALSASGAAPYTTRGETLTP